MTKISVIGICGNSTFMYADHFHENGETLVADSVFEEIGGKGINQAIAARRMKAEVRFLLQSEMMKTAKNAKPLQMQTV